MQYFAVFFHQKTQQKDRRIECIRRSSKLIWLVINFLVYYPLYGFFGKRPPLPTTQGLAVLPGAFPPFGTRTMLMPSSRLASPDVPAIWPFFVQPSQPYVCVMR